MHESLGAAPFHPRGSHGDEPHPPEMPVFDLLSDDPLPEISEEDQRVDLGAVPPELESSDSTPDASHVKDDFPEQVAHDSPNDEVRGKFWFEGDVVMCGCPDCGAPMSVRVWLMVADCWRCPASIEMTEEEEREIQRMLKDRQADQRPVQGNGRPRSVSAGESPLKETRNGNSTKASPAPRKAQLDRQPAKSNGSIPAKRTAAPRSKHNPAPRRTDRKHPRPMPAIAPASVTRTNRRIQQVARSGSAGAVVGKMLGHTPAWLVSLVFHLLLLTVLALLYHEQPESSSVTIFVTSQAENDPKIRLTTQVNDDPHEGEQAPIVDPNGEVDLDLPLPGNVDLNDEEVRDSVIKAQQDALQLRLAGEASTRHLAPLDVVKRTITSENTARRTFAARDPRVRAEMVTQEGGTTLTEAAVARALRWLARHQEKDGSWSLHDYDDRPNCNCGPHRHPLRELVKSDRDSIKRSDMAGTSLALLPFLGAGQTHLTGIYQDTVSRGLRWMMKQQRADGYLQPESAGMYAHGQGAIVLCEAYAISGDEQLRAAAQKSIDFIAKSQYNDGGWRYHPGPPTSQGDTSVLGWQLMALQSAKIAGLDVPEKTLQGASKFLTSVSLAAPVQELVEDQQRIVATLDELIEGGQWSKARQRQLVAKQRKVAELLIRNCGSVAADCRNEISQAALRLESARGPEQAREQTRAALKALESFRDEWGGSRYGYLKDRPPIPTMTAEALLCRMYLGWTKQEPGLGHGIEWLSKSYPPRKTDLKSGRGNMYYWYYATQVMHNYGGPSWHKWNADMRDILVGSQETEGHRAGSWSPVRGDTGKFQFIWANAGGRIYVTALAACTLEVYYRHLPLFKQIELE